MDEERDEKLEPEGARAGPIGRALVGALMFAIVGFLYSGVWALTIGPDWRAALLGALAASAVFGSITGVAAVWVAPSRFKLALLGCFAGGAGGVVWWLIVQPGA